MKVSDVMSKQVYTCSESDTLQRAAQLMWDYDIGCVVVYDGRHVKGVITDRDIAMSALLRGGDLASHAVGDVMTREVRAVSPNDDLRVAEERMGSAQVRRLPVIDVDKLVGIVSLNDLASEAGKSSGRRVRYEEAGSVLAAVGKHRAPQSVPPLQRVA